MKELLESYDLLFFLLAVTALSLLLKMVGYILYHRLLWDSGQMGTTQNKWMKAMMLKFEAYYKLRLSVHNVENFVDHYLYHYRFLGMSLQTWENLGKYFTGVLVACAALGAIAGGYYGMSSDWYFISGFVVAVLLCVQGAAEVFFNMPGCHKLFRIQLIDYMENTMRARLENEYFNQEATKEYQMEYFEDDASDNSGDKPEQKAEDEIGEKVEFQYMRKPDTEQDTALDNRDVKELLASLLEEIQIDKELSDRQRAMTEYAATERAQLFEEILKEFM